VRDRARPLDHLSHTCRLEWAARPVQQQQRPGHTHSYLDCFHSLEIWRIDVMVRCTLHFVEETDWEYKLEFGIHGAAFGYVQEALIVVTGNLEVAFDRDRGL
jgi:hypothetical protein